MIEKEVKFKLQEVMIEKEVKFKLQNLELLSMQIID
jgi:hypothetical protein